MAVCVTFDNMGLASAVGRGEASGPDPSEPGLSVGYPRLLRLLDELDLRATFFVEGWNGLHHPEHVRRLVGAGHEVGVHGWVHERWDSLDEPTAQRLLVDSTVALRNAGATISGFRPPGGHLRAGDPPLLASLGYTYASTLDSDLAATHPGGIAHVPVLWDDVDIRYYIDASLAEEQAMSSLAARWEARLDAAAQGDTPVVLAAHVNVSCLMEGRFRLLAQALERVATDFRGAVRLMREVAEAIRGAVPTAG